MVETYVNLVGLDLITGARAGGVFNSLGHHDCNITNISSKISKERQNFTR